MTDRLGPPLTARKWHQGQGRIRREVRSNEEIHVDRPLERERIFAAWQVFAIFTGGRQLSSPPSLGESELLDSAKNRSGPSVFIERTLLFIRLTDQNRSHMKFRSLLLICLMTLFAASTLTAQELLRPSFLPEKLEDANGKKMDSSALAGKYIGLYFSASWCGPCRAFTPKLKQFRDDHLDEGFEVVLVNFDKSNTEKRRYIRDAGMEWPSLPGARRKASKSLAETYQVKGYPTLIILDPSGNVVTNLGVEAIINEPETVFGQWLKFEIPNA